MKLPGKEIPNWPPEAIEIVKSVVVTSLKDSPLYNKGIWKEVIGWGVKLEIEIKDLGKQDYK